VAAQALTLYEAEENLLALAQCADTVAPEQEAQFLADFGAALLAAAEKRDRVAQFLAHLEMQQEFAAQEIRRLQERKMWYAKVQQHLETYVIHVIEEIGLDAKGRYRKLEGNTSTLSVRSCPDSVQILDEFTVPADYKIATVALPAKLWEEVIDSLDIDLDSKVLAAVEMPKLAISKSAVRKAMGSGVAVAGCELLKNRLSLVRK